MVNNKLVSVIVPVYNVEKYLRTCVESLIHQTYKNIEIILVDDKSTDSSGAMCDELGERDERISVIHKAKNEGLNMARKTGFDASHGDYVAFLDSDDFFHINNIEDSLKALLDNRADVAIYGFKEFSDHDEKTKSLSEDVTHEIKQLTTKLQIARYAFFGESNLPGMQYMTVWGKLYSRKVVERVDWSAANFRLYEDSFWTPQVLLGSNRVVLMSNPLIYYRRNVAYGVNGSNLGNRLTGNSINGRAVGYLEYIELMTKFYGKLARRHGFDSKLDERINKQSFLSKTWRIDNLAKAGLLESENNLEVMLRVLPQYIEAKDRHIDNLEATITYLNTEVESYKAEITRLRVKLESYLGIKKSAKLLAGNIKRRVTRS